MFRPKEAWAAAIAALLGAALLASHTVFPPTGSHATTPSEMCASLGASPSSVRG